MHPKDDILVHRTLCGDESAFALLVERYQGVVYRIAYREIENHHDAEDIAQEAFLKAYCKLKTLKDPNTFSSWLYAITVNLCKSWWRKRKRQVDTIELSKAPLEPTAYEFYAQQEQKTVLWDAVNALATKDRSIMTMFYREGYSTKEIGEQMGITQNQVLVRLHRARQKLKEEFIMAHQTYAIGEIQPSFIKQVMDALPKQTIAPYQPIISLGLGKSIALVTAALVALSIGFGGSFLSNETPPPTTSRSEEAMGVFLLNAPGQQLALSINALQAATDKKEHKLPAGQPGAVVWGQGWNIQGIVQIAEPVYHGGSLWANQTAPGAYETWVNERTTIQLAFIGKKISLSSEELFKQPLLLISGNKLVKFNKAERDNLRKYLVEKGGLLIVDEVPGSGFVSSIQTILKEVLPDSQTTLINNDHEIYRIYYEMNGPPIGAEIFGKNYVERMRKLVKAKFGEELPNEELPNNINYLEGTFLKENLLALYSHRNYWLYLTEDVWDSTKATKHFFSNVLVYAITHGNIADYSDYVP